MEQQGTVRAELTRSPCRGPCPYPQYIIDDFREAYFWLRQNTPEDAKVMSWWDYGYQLTGMANRYAGANLRAPSNECWFLTDEPS